MLGISVYFQDLNLKYLEEAKKCGAKYVFTSLHIPEENSAMYVMPIILNIVDRYPESRSI